MADAIDNGSKYTKRSKDNAKMLDYWDKTDAIVEGYEAVKAAAEVYLPKFPAEPNSDYATRLGLSKFTNIYRDVLEGLASKPFEQEISLKDQEKIDQQLKDFIEDVDGSGNNLTVFSAATFFNGINSAIDWIFVDYPETDKTKIVTVADLKKSGIKPFWSRVLARNVLEVRTKIINGKEVFSYIRIFEPAANGSEDKVRIFERSDDGRVSFELYVKNTDKSGIDKEDFVLEKKGPISIDVIPLVPFVTGRRDGNSFYFYPPMKDAADLQITLYQDESALQFIKTMAGYPMLAANGMKPEMDADGKTPKKIAIGPMKVLYGVPDANGNHGTWSYIEPSANSMKFLLESIDKTKQDLRELGRQPLTAQSGQLTVITTAVAAGKARTAVGAWAINLQNSIENALIITCKWLNIKDYKPEVKIYDEFDNFTDSTADITALTTMREKRDLSQKTLWSEMKRRKVLSDDFDADEELKLITDEIPSDANVDLGNVDDQGNPKPVTKPKK